MGKEGIEPSTLGVGNLYSQSTELQTHDDSMAIPCSPVAISKGIRRFGTAGRIAKGHFTFSNSDLAIRKGTKSKHSEEVIRSKIVSRKC
jgi:hypothetical protein